MHNRFEMGASVVALFDGSRGTVVGFNRLNETVLIEWNDIDCYPPRSELPNYNVVTVKDYELFIRETTKKAIEVERRESQKRIDFLVMKMEQELSRG